jgi:DNA polymerase (family 10)
MADYTLANKYEYLVISDHSKSAFYANGLNEERVEMQWREIDGINKTMSPFKIFKGIECDILNDGSLDYSDDFLEGFEVVIASIHSNLKMTPSHAMERLLSAVRHPKVHILGHPTGRLLLARSGYDIDHQLLIDECAKYGVALELNANPQRLDLDWQWIPYAIDKGVYIAINPDAHSKNAIHHIKYGVNVARKGGLTAENCLNNMNIAQFEAWLAAKRR